MKRKVASRGYTTWLQPCVASGGCNKRLRHMLATQG